ncbi:MAG: hypothetical protein ABJG88_03335 [Litorimonas sp.]
MKLLSKITTGFLAVGMMTPSAFAQTYDIAGVTLDMTPDQVASALKSKGYVPDKSIKFVSLNGAKIETVYVSQTPQYNYKQAVKINELTFENPKISYAEIEKTLPLSSASGVLTMAFKKGDGREKIKVEFIELPSGSYSRAVNYVLKDLKLTRDVAKDKAFQKYDIAEKNAFNNYVGEEITRDSFLVLESLRISPANGKLSLVLKSKFDTREYKKLIDSSSKKPETDISSTF